MMGDNRWAVSAAVLASAVLAVAGIGCGGDDAASDPAGANAGDSKTDPGARALADPDSPGSKIRASYQSYVDAYYDEDARGICDKVTEREAAEFGKQGCTAYFKLMLSQGDPGANRPYVVKLSRDGSRAVATVKTKTSNEYRVAFRKAQKGWLIDDGLLPKGYKPGSAIGAGGASDSKSPAG